MNPQPGEVYEHVSGSSRIHLIEVDPDTARWRVRRYNAGNAWPVDEEIPTSVIAKLWIKVGKTASAPR